MKGDWDAHHRWRSAGDKQKSLVRISAAPPEYRVLPTIPISLDHGQNRTPMDASAQYTLHGRGMCPPPNAAAS